MIFQKIDSIVSPTGEDEIKGGPSQDSSGMHSQKLTLQLREHVHDCTEQKIASAAAFLTKKVLYRKKGHLSSWELKQAVTCRVYSGPLLENTPHLSKMNRK